MGCLVFLPVIVTDSILAEVNGFFRKWEKSQWRPYVGWGIKP